jgi:hypothetical protein
MLATRPLFPLFLATVLLAVSAEMSSAHETKEGNTKLKIKQEVTRSAHRMSFQFDGSRSLNGFLLNVGSVDVRVDGYVVRVPMAIVDAVRFSQEFGGDCNVRLTNGDSLRGVISKFDFEIATDWGTVDVARPALRSMSAIKPPKNPPRLNAPRPATTPQRSLPASQALPTGSTSANQPAGLSLPQITPAPWQRQVIMETPHQYFGL